MPSGRIAFAVWALVVSFLALLVAIGRPPEVAAALTEAGYICRIEGPATIGAGKPALFAWRIQDSKEDLLPTARDRFNINLGNLTGSSKITALVIENTTDAVQGFDKDDYRTINPTTKVRGADVENPGGPGTGNDITDALLDFLATKFGYHLQSNVCGPTGLGVYVACVRDGFCGDFKPSTSQRDAWVKALDQATKSEVNCGAIGDAADRALILAGYTAPAGRGQIEAYWLSVCYTTGPGLRVGPILDDVGFVVVTCYQPGTFQLSISDQNQAGDTMSIKVTCRTVLS